MKKEKKDAEEEDKLHKLINVKQLSRNLSGNETSIRRDKYPEIYKKAVEELDSAVKRWAKKNPEVELAKRLREPKEKRPFQIKEEKKPAVGKKISQAKVEIESVPAELREGPFYELKPPVANLTQNGNCYKVDMWRMRPTEQFIGYFMVKKDALEYMESVSKIVRNEIDYAGPEYHKYK